MEPLARLCFFMADFISRILPFLPKSLQSEELADAASNFNRFSQLLAFVPNDHRERELVRYWEGQVQAQLASPEPTYDDEHLNILYDQVSLLVYLRSIDHWTSQSMGFPAHWAVGLLLHSPFPRNRWLGVLTAAVQLQAGCKEARLLLGNSVGRLLEGDEDSVMMGLRLAYDCLDGDMAALFSPGVRRALRSRFSKVRGRAWMVFARIVSLEASVHVDEMEVVQLAKKEEHVCVLTRIIGFLGQSIHHFPADSALLITNDVYKRLMRNRWSVHEVTLISKTLWLLHGLHPFTPEDVPELCRLLQRAAGELEEGIAKDGLCLEILRIIASIKGPINLDELDITGFVMPFFFKENLAVGLKFLEILVKIAPTSILSYQHQLLSALNGKDPAIVMLALQVVLLAANQTNWLSIMDACSKVYLDKSVELDMKAQAIRKAVFLVTKFDLDRPRIAQKIFEDILGQGSAGFGEIYVEQIVDDLLCNHLDTLKTSKWAFLKERSDGAFFPDLCLVWLFGKHSFDAELERAFLIRKFASFLADNDHLSCVIVISSLLRTGFDISAISFDSHPKLEQLAKSTDWCHQSLTFDQVLEAAHNVAVPSSFAGDCKAIEKIFGATKPILDNLDANQTCVEEETTTEDVQSPFATLQDMSTFPSPSPVISDLFKGIL